MSHQPYYDTPNHLGPPGPSQGRPFSAGPSQPYSRSRSRSPPRRRDDPYGAPPPRRDDDGGGYPGGVGYTRSSGFAREDPYHGGSGVRSGPPGGVGGRDRWPNDRYNQGGPSTEPGAPPGWGVDHYAGGPRGPPPVQRGPGWLDPRQEAPWPQHNGGGSYGPVVCRTLFHFGIVFILTAIMVASSLSSSISRLPVIPTPSPGSALSQSGCPRSVKARLNPRGTSSSSVSTTK